MSFFDSATRSLSEDWRLCQSRGCSMLVTLKGPLGAGKTTFVQELMKTLGYSLPVPSPTFLKLIEHVLPSGCQVCHVDAYRLLDLSDRELLEEFEKIGLGFYDDQPRLWLVEWPEPFEKWLTMNPSVINSWNLKRHWDLTLSSHHELKLSPGCFNQ